MLITVFIIFISNCKQIEPESDTHFVGIIENNSSNVVIVSYQILNHTAKTVMLTPKMYNEGGSCVRVFENYFYKEEYPPYNYSEFISNFVFLSVKKIVENGDTLNYKDSADLRNIYYWEYRRNEFYLEIDHTYYLIIK